MALPSICAELANGKDLSCYKPTSKYYQQLVLINFADIDPDTVVAPWLEEEPAECVGSVQFVLNSGATGYRFTFPERSALVFGTFDYAITDQGYPSFIHRINFGASALSAEDKCMLQALLTGKFVAAVQLSDGTVEVYGLQNGLYAEAFTFDTQTNGGVTPVTLASLETNPESYVPLVYEAQGGSTAEADFDDNFANGGS